MKRIRSAVLAVAGVALLVPSPAAFAGGGPENVAVVVNADSWASLTVANEYIHLRRIPPGNVVSLKLGDLWNFETVDVETFRTRVLRPVLQALEERRLVGQVDCIAYSADLPYAVNAQKDLGGKKTGRSQPIASITGLTYLYPLVLAKDARYLSLRTNFYYRAARRSTASPGSTRPAVLALPPSQAFRNRHAWSPGGSIVPPGKGLRYVLSTMLAVTSGRGNSVREAVRCLRRAAGADGTRPKGTIYLMSNKDIRSRTRKWAFESTVVALAESGVSAEVIEGVLPKKKADVMGLAAGTAGFNWAGTGSTILPGAICEHLTSFGGVMHQRGGQTPISEFIRHGAAGSSGTVTEPMAIQAKFPTPFLHAHYARGCSLAEAFYQSVAGPYQLLILGDPLCRPWARIPQPSVAGVKPGQVVKGKLSLKPDAKGPPGVSIGRYELFVDGRRRAGCRPGAGFDLDTTALPDGHHELRIVAVADDGIETQGTLIVPIVVSNHGRPPVATCPTKRPRWGDPIVIHASLPGATRIDLLHNGRVVHSAPGARARAQLDSRVLGMGPVQIHAVGVIKGKDGGSPRIRALPIELTVEPPRTLRALRARRGTKFAPGLKVTTADGKVAVVKDLRDVFAVEKAGVRNARAFVLQGCFDVPDSDVYQFQVLLSGAMTLKVSSTTVLKSQGGGWQFVPVSLAKGTHRFLLAGKPEARPRLDLRFGGRGAQSPTDKTFRHIARGS